jgi:Asp/Glu/hydantoin racemase
MGVYKGATPDQVTDSLEKRAKELVSDDGAQIIIPLGAAMIPYVVRPESIQERVGYPVINTVSTAIGFAEMLVARGMRHSELAYPFTPLAPEDVS